MICAYYRKLLNVDDVRKELWGGKPDAKSFIMADGCTVLMY